MARNKIFISHATPADDDFTKWLALKLIGLGYYVWCDILFLEKGVDFWKDIEHEIRENTCRFLVALSNISNQSAGVLNEIAVAIKVKKEFNDNSFIIPLMIDSNFSYDKINIELNRLNAIDFTQSWIKGLRELLTSFDDNKIPKNLDNLALSNELHNKIFLHDRMVLIKEEPYDSNWFPIQIDKFPQHLYFHAISHGDFDFFASDFSFPVIHYKNTFCTFSSDIGYTYKGNDLINTEKTLEIPAIDILQYKDDSPFIGINESRLYLVRLLNEGFNRLMSSIGFRTYALTNKTAYWFEKGFLPKNQLGSILMVGKRKENNWHFGISGYVKLLPLPILIINSHIFFTTNGKDLIFSKERQLKLRIKQGKNWYNNIWRVKLFAIMKYLSKGEDFLKIPVGKNEFVEIRSFPIKLLSHVSYKRPKDNLQEEDIVEYYEEEDDIIL
jgi:hypothetical protein